MKDYYIVEEFINGTCANCFTINEKELWEYMQKNIEKNEIPKNKFVIYKVGECLIDLT